VTAQRTARTGRENDRYDPELGLRVRRCADCRRELPISDFAGGNPNCAECRTRPPAEPAAPLPVYGPPEPRRRACTDPEHTGPRLVDAAAFTKPDGTRTDICRPCWKRQWIRSRRTRKNLRVQGIKR
jgi:hypothetical protein